MGNILTKERNPGNVAEKRARIEEGYKGYNSDKSDQKREEIDDE